jgi:PAS domain S-box-containing protein
MKILIVDDKPENRYLLETLLNGKGYKATSAANGEEALEKLRSECVDLIISDILMPVMDGFQLCRACKGDPALKEIPFVFYTATYVDDKDEAFAYDLGADRFIRKPVEPDAFISMIQEVIQGVEAGGVAPRKPVKRDEQETFKRYSERLVQKLEKKVADLENELEEKRKAQQELERSKERYRIIFDGSRDAIFIADRDARFVEVNEGASQLTGYATEELLQMSIPQLHDPGDLHAYETYFNRIMSGEEVTSEARILHKDGTKVDFEFSNRRVFINGKPHMHTVARDISERRKGERAIRENERFLRDVLESIQDGVSILNPDLTIRQVNSVMKEWYKANLPLEGKKCFRRYHNRDAPCDPCPSLRCLKTGRTEMDIVPGLPGSPVEWIELFSFPMKDPDSGTMTGMVEFVRDISRKKKAEDTLEASKAFVEKLIHTMPDGFSLLDKEGVHVDVNPALCRMTGFSKEELIGVGLPHPYWPEEEFSRIQDAFQKTLDSNFDHFELVFKRKDGERFPVIVSPAAVSDADGTITHYFASIKDISDRKQYEEALRDQLHMLQELMDSIPTPIFYKDVDGIYQGCNTAFEALAGMPRDEIVGKDTHEVFPPALAEAYVQHDREVLESLIPATYESSPPGADSKPRHVIFNKAVFRKADGNIGGIIGAIFDITDRKVLEAQLVEAQKIEAIGTLAGGIAHDFNNILSAIMGYTELAMSRYSLPERAVSDLKKVLKASERAKNLVAQILTVSRHHDQERRPLQPALIVKEVLKLLRATLPATIEIKQEISKDAGVVEADPSQLHQVLMNLCTNAAQAMGQRTGALTVTLKNVDLDAAHAARYLKLKSGSYVRLSVEDTGCGIPARDLERIFDPYFSTKEQGEGTGLGLSVVKGIVERHSGAIEVESELGRGTAIYVYLPRILEKASEETGDPGPMPAGTERILFVDDEPSLAEIGRRMLESLGYRVETCTRSLQALALFQDDPKRFDLVVTDLTMPELTGVDLARKMTEIRPDLPVILCTGHGTQKENERARGAGIRGFLGKPFISWDLGLKVREVLDG